MLASGGRFVLLTATPALQDGGPWAPALLTYASEQLRMLLLDAGFVEVSVDEIDGAQLAVARL